MKLHKAAYRPRQWFRIGSAPTDGRPIIMRHPDWTHHIVVSWGNLAANGFKSDEEEGWIWENIVIEHTAGAEAFDLAQVENSDMTKATWSHFGITPKGWKYLDQLEQLADRHTAHSAH